MRSRSFDEAELAAIQAWLEQRAVTRCPDTARGEPLPHIQERTIAQVIHALHRAAA